MALRYYGVIQHQPEQKRWAINELEPHVSIKLKAVFPKIGKTEQPPLYFDDTPEICRDLEWFLSRYPLEISHEDEKFLHDSKFSHLTLLDDLEKLLKPDYTPQTFALRPGEELRKYQAQAVEVYLKNKRLLVGDDLGLGKTLVGIGSMTAPEALPVLVVVQTHLPTQWKNMIEKFVDVKVHLIKGTKPYSLPPADVYITKYSCLAGWTDTYRMGIFKSVVFDEIQELRHSDSNKYLGAQALCEKVEYACGLSATPIYNFPNEIYNILNLLKPGCLGNYGDFQREWAGYGKVIKNPKALGTYLRENFLFLRRTREEVKLELPVVNKIVHTVDFDEKAVKSVEDIARQLAITMTSGAFIERGKAARSLNIMIRQMTGVSKAKYVAEYVKILLENGEPVLLAGWHREVYEIWLKELAAFNPVMYTGTESPAQKEKSKADFMSGKSNLMIISHRSGVGLDGLQQRGSIVVFGELDWSPQVHDQIIGRLNRDGQTKQVTAIYLVSNSGSDPLMIDLLGLKASQSRGIIDPLQAIQAQYSDESRIKLLAEQYLRGETSVKE